MQYLGRSALVLGPLQSSDQVLSQGFDLARPTTGTLGLNRLVPPIARSVSRGWGRDCSGHCPSLVVRGLVNRRRPGKVHSSVKTNVEERPWQMDR